MAEAQADCGINSPENYVDDEQQKVMVEDIIKNINTYAFMMKRSLDLDAVVDAFKHARKFIDCLKTGELTPSNYNQIYLEVQTNLLYLRSQLHDPRFQDKDIREQYEISQYETSCLSRLYCMVTLSTELVHRKVIKVLDMLEDISEMIKQAQDPIRALFLRNFMLLVWKQDLPDSTEQETERSLNFLLNNFVQMNRMWVRIADLMATDNRREQRSQLSELIGKNIQQISTLHGITIDNYSHIILPFFAKHVELCEDDMAQEFILQSIIQAFPEEYHINTIDPLFSVFCKVEPNVKILQIVDQLLDRLYDYEGDHIDSTTGKQIFVTIAKNIEELFGSEGHLTLKDKLSTLLKLLRFALKVSPEETRNIQNLMKFTNYHVDLAIGDGNITDQDTSKALRDFIDYPLSTFEKAEPLYRLDSLPELIRRLFPTDRVEVAARVCNIYNNSSTMITNKQELQFVLQLTSSIVQEDNGRSCFYSLFHLIDAGSIMATMKIIYELSNSLISSEDNQVTVRPEAQKKALLPIGFIAIKLLHDADPDEANALFTFILEHGKRALTFDPQVAIKIFIETARVLDTLEGFESKVTALTGEAINTWTKLTDQTIKYRVFSYILQYVVSSPSVETKQVNSSLCTMAAQFTEPMKSVTALTGCASLFWRPDGRLRTSEAVQACLSKASKAADSAGSIDQATMLHGLYLVLGNAAYFLEKKVQLQFKWLKALTGIIQDKHQEIQAKGLSLETILPINVREFYVSTVRHIQSNNLLPQPGDQDDDEEEAEMEEDEGAPQQAAEADAEEDEGEVEEDEGEADGEEDEEED